MNAISAMDVSRALELISAMDVSRGMGGKMPMRKIVVVAFGCCVLAIGSLGQPPAPTWVAPGQGGGPWPGGAGAGPAPGYGQPAPSAPYPGGAGQSGMMGTPAGPELGTDFPVPDLAGAPEIPPAWVTGLWNPQPILEVRAEVMFLQPSFEPSTPIANAYILDADGLAYVSEPVSIGVKEAYATSGRVAMDLHLNPYHSVETVGFISDGPDLDDARVGPTDTTFFLDANAINTLQQGFLTNIPVGFPTIVERMRLDWDFEAFGGEVNYHRHFICVNGPCADLAVGLGIRYFGFREKTEFTAYDLVNGLTGRMNARTSNDLLGPQVTARATLPLPWNRLRLFSEGKIGLMANKVTDETFISPARAISTTTYGRTQFSPLFEGNFRVEFYVFEHLTLFGGFQLIYADRVDRAGGQYTQNLDVFVLEHKELGSLFSFGPTAGLLVQY